MLQVNSWGRKTPNFLPETIPDRLVLVANKGNQHWVVILADLKRQQLVYFDPMGGKDTMGFTDNLSRYIKEEFQVQHV